MRRKTTIYLEDSVLRALKIAAIRAGQHDYEVIEQALRAHLGIDLLHTGSKSGLDEKGALDFSYQELQGAAGVSDSKQKRASYCAANFDPSNLFCMSSSVIPFVSG